MNVAFDLGDVSGSSSAVAIYIRDGEVYESVEVHSVADAMEIRDSLLELAEKLDDELKSSVVTSSSRRQERQ